MSVLAITIIAFEIYLIPGIFAYCKQSDRWEDVLAINVAFGWLPPVWLGLLVIAIWE